MLEFNLEAKVREIFHETSSKLQTPPDKIWDMPLIACAKADDEFFPQLKHAIAPDHLLPYDLLPEARSVVVYFIPFKPFISKDNAANYPMASKMWAEAYVMTNKLISLMNDEISQILASLGYKCAVTPPTHNFDEKRLISRWSHKHIAYIAGLGTFGINQLLITSKGCCGRLGSFVTSAPFTPTQRPKGEYCLEKAGQQCSKCINRCPVKALSVDKFNRHLCYERLLENDRFYSDLPLTDVCGQCSCEIPCSHGVPTL